MSSIDHHHLRVIEDHLRVIEDKLADHHRHLLTIQKNQEKIMTAISDYAAKVKESFATISAGLDGIVGDLQTLNDKITQLQNNPGPITPADQALLDEAQALSASLATRVSAIDAQTPPTPPPA